MSEDETRQARQRKRTSASRRFVVPDNVYLDEAFIDGPPKSAIAENKPPSAGNAPPGSQGQTDIQTNEYGTPGGNQNRYGQPRAQPQANQFGNVQTQGAL